MQHTAALVPGHVKMPPPAEVPEELWSYYTSLTMEPSDVLSFGYQIASGMVSRDHPFVCCLVLAHLSLPPSSPGVPDWTGYPAQGPVEQEHPHDYWQVPEIG